MIYKRAVVLKGLIFYFKYTFVFGLFTLLNLVSIQVRVGIIGFGERKIDVVQQQCHGATLLSLVQENRLTNDLTISHYENTI